MDEVREDFLQRWQVSADDRLLQERGWRGQRLCFPEQAWEHTAPGPDQPCHQKSIWKSQCRRREKRLLWGQETEPSSAFFLPYYAAFCTRLCERETNVKVIQKIMGHADIQTTLDIYAEVTDAVKHKTMEKIQGEEEFFWGHHKKQGKEGAEVCIMYRGSPFLRVQVGLTHDFCSEIFLLNSDVVFWSTMQTAYSKNRLSLL